MSALLGIPVAGHVVPGIINPNIRRSFVTNTPLGPPAKIQGTRDLPKVPQPIGDDKNPAILEHITKMLAKEISKPISEAMPSMRDWR